MKRHVLLIEDNKEFAKITKLLLESHPFKVDVAQTGAEGLKKSQLKPDIILLDRTLPDIEGLQVCRKLRESKSTSSIPIVILSARNKPSDRVEGLYFGADDYIAKPFENEELVARIEAILRRIDFYAHANEQREEFISQINQIINEDLITAYYQTIYDAKSYEPFGVEAFSRPPADHPLANPEFLFKAALMVGKYFDLEMIGWRKAIGHWKTVKNIKKLFLNCSPYLVENDRFDSTTLEKMGVASHDIILEVTERSAIQDYRLFFDRLKSSRKLGLQIAVDDVGSGFASLDTVVHLRPDFVKIDMVLIHDIHKDSLKRNIVESIINFCKKSSVLTVAEGIEKKEELLVVKDLGADFLQGYLLSRPKPKINVENAFKE